MSSLVAAASGRATVPRVVILRLGWRLLRGSEARRLVSMALVVIGVGLAVLSILSGLAAFHTVHARAERTAARSFLDAPDGQAPDAWTDVHRMPYGNAMVRRVDIALSAHPLPPAPGLTRWPAPGEEIVSPAFANAARSDPTLHAYAPGRIVGQIDAAGLHAPDELAVYRGVPREALPRGGVGVVTRHGEPDTALALDQVEMSSGQLAGLMGLYAVIVGLPTVAFLSVAARLAASTRSRRLATLHLLGMPGSAVRAVNAVEVCALVLLGDLWSLVAYPWANHVLAGSGLLGIHWFPSDTALSWPTSGAFVLASVAFAALVARRTDSGGNLPGAAVRRAAAPGAASAWRLVPLAVGATSLLAQVVVGVARPAQQTPFIHLDLLMIVAVLTTGLGLLLGVTPLTRMVGRLAAHRGRSLALRIGGARAAFDPAASGRLVAGLALLVFAAGVTIGQTRDARAVSTPTASSVDVTVNLADVPASHRADLLTRTGTPAVVILSTDPRNSAPLQAVIASCAQLARFLAVDGSSTPTGCTDHAAYWSPRVPAERRSTRGLPIHADVSGKPGVLPPAVTSALGELDVLLTDDTATTLTAVAAGPATGDGTTVYTDQAQLLLRTRPGAVDVTLASIYHLAPYSQPAALGLDPDSGERIAMINGYIRLGLLTGAGMALIALITALADRTTERRRADAELLAGGAPADLVRKAHRWEVGLTLAAVISTATVTGILGGLAWQYAGGLIRTPDWEATIVLLLTAIAASTLAISVAAALAPRRLQLSALRSE